MSFSAFLAPVALIAPAQNQEIVQLRGDCLDRAAAAYEAARDRGFDFRQAMAVAFEEAAFSELPRLARGKGGNRLNRKTARQFRRVALALAEHEGAVLF